ncbi:type VI secretion system Vgr family protein [Nannocystis pusilla]|uniref:Type VI secretion system tip protein VgrG n=1 Tax=Nannocystis pusilla TaxID=889268 RepID=A0ABS7TU10_9BACT|nr:type VI secretion system tip protein TssI/VgrG [Nannocystis pusilla]MBZ5711710.1 type VI secretion system tip protein VgrG [Nannocystis pusilla]
MIGGNSARFEVAGSANQFWVLRFSGVEAVSELYEFQIELTARFEMVDEMVGAYASLRLAGTDRAARTIHGLLCRAEYTGELPPRSTYRVCLVPDVWKMQFRTTSRIFQRMSTPQILEAVLGESGIRYRLRLAGSYSARDYCVQYRESDLSFIRRLMEEDGIAFYFEHEEDAHTLVLSDINTGRERIQGDPALPFRVDEKIRGSEHVRKFSLGHQITPGATVVRDHDHYVSRNVEARDQAPRGAAQLELYDAPIGARDPAIATMQAKLRLEAARVGGVVATGTSDCPRLVPGHSFLLADHMRHEFDGEYHVLRTIHRGEQPRIVYADAELVYDNDFVAIPVTTPYRPPRVTKVPTIRGVQTATVVGPAGEEIYVDEQGRVKVQFHWDRAAPFSELSSCWVRVSQAWAGPSYGSFFLPRIGHEVLVEFIEGDPNRPIVTGRIYDGTRQPPYPLPEEKTKSTIKSDSSPGGGGFNELRFEDAKGTEEIFIHAQYDMNTIVLHDATRDVGNDDHLTVANNQTEDVGVDRSATVGSNETMFVGVDQRLDVGQHQTNTIGQNQINTIGLNQSTTIGANQATTVGGAQENIVGGDHSLSVHGHVLTVAGMDNALAVGGNQHVQVLGARTLEVGLDQTTTVLGNVMCDVTMMVSASVGTDLLVTVGMNNTVTIGATQNLVVGAERVTMVGANDTLTVTGALTVSAATIVLSAGGSTITLSPAGIDISSAGVVSINGSLVTTNMGAGGGGGFF